MADPRRSLGYRIGAAIQAILLGGFLALCRMLPVDAASALGGWLGRSIGPHLGQNRIAARNLSRAMPENRPERNRAILRGMWDNLGRVVSEYPHLANICSTLEGGRIEICGADHIRHLIQDAGPGLLFGAHLANWEVLPTSAPLVGLDLAVIYRAPNNPWVDRMLRRLRNNPRQFRKGKEGAREMIAHLRKGGRGAMLVDQKMNDGIPVPFFGRDAMTAPAIAQFALRLGAVIVPVRTQRLRGARFRITVMPPLQIGSTGDRSRDVMAIMSEINRVIESWIRESPEQWLWLHRRWPD